MFLQKSDLPLEEGAEILIVERTIEAFIQQNGIEIPKANQRNTYTKACYLLGQLQRLGLDQLRLRTHDSRIREVLGDRKIKTLIDNLDVLRQSIPILQKKYIGIKNGG